MSFGICGAHRVGKTTLCLKLSKHMKAPFVETNVSEVFNRFGIRADETLEPNERMMIQSEILNHCEAAWRRQKAPFFTDRTPIDLIAYTEFDLAKTGCSEKVWKRFLSYKARCFDLCGQIFSHICLVQPGIPLVDPGDKNTASVDSATVHHINHVMKGLVVSEYNNTAFSIIPEDVTDLDERKVMIAQFLVRSYAMQCKISEDIAFH